MRLLKTGILFFFGQLCLLGSAGTTDSRPPFRDCGNSIIDAPFAFHAVELGLRPGQTLESVLMLPHPLALAYGLRASTPTPEQCGRLNRCRIDSNSKFNTIYEKGSHGLVVSNDGEWLAALESPLDEESYSETWLLYSLVNGTLFFGQEKWGVNYRGHSLEIRMDKPHTRRPLFSKPLKSVPTHSALSNVHFSPDNKKFLLTTERHVVIRKVGDRSESATILPDNPEYLASTSSGWFFHGGRSVVLLNSRGQLSLWDPGGTTPLDTAEVETGIVMDSVVVSPDARYISFLVANLNFEKSEPPTIHREVWSTTGGGHPRLKKLWASVPKTKRKHGFLPPIVFASQSFLVGLESGEADLYEMEGAAVRLEKRWKGHSEPVTRVAWAHSKGHDVFATASSEGHLCFWNKARQQRKACVNTGILHPRQLLLSPGAQYVGLVGPSKTTAYVVATSAWF